MDKPATITPEGYEKTSKEVHPMAFTIQFGDQKIDGSRKSKIQERLSAFALKHRRNPSLPDFAAVKNAKATTPVDKLPSPLSSQQVPTIGKVVQKPGCQSDEYFLSDRDDEASLLKNSLPHNKICQIIEKKCSNLNGLGENLPKHLKNGRRSSLNDIEAHKLSCQEKLPIKVEFKVVKNKPDVEVNNVDNKSDTVSEAGTYTVDKEDEPAELNKTHTLDVHDGSEEESEAAKENCNYHHKWINDWVNKVAEQNMLHPVEPPPIVTKSSGSGGSSPGASKIPSPVNTLPNKTKLKASRGNEVSKVNGSLQHRRSSSLSAKVSYLNKGKATLVS